MRKKKSQIDPVCGKDLTGKKGVIKTFEYENQTYYFCSVHCYSTFVSEPDDFVGENKLDGAGDEIVELQDLTSVEAFVAKLNQYVVEHNELAGQVVRLQEDLKDAESRLKTFTTKPKSRRATIIEADNQISAKLFLRVVRSFVKDVEATFETSRSEDFGIAKRCLEQAAGTFCKDFGI